MATLKILCLLTSFALPRRGETTQNAKEISSDRSELFLVSSFVVLSVENVTSCSVTDVFIVVNGNNSHRPDKELTTDGSKYVDSLEQVFTTVEDFVQKYVVFTINIFSFFSCILTIIVLQRGVLKSSSTVYIRGIAMSSVLATLLYFFYTISHHDSVSQRLAFQNVFSYVFAYGDVLFYISMASNVWIILAFALERLFAIFFPLKSRMINSESRAKKIVAVIFVVAVLVNVPRFFRVAVTITKDPLTNDTLHVWSYTSFGRDPFSTKAIYMFFAIVVVIIPFPLLAILNCLIIVKLRLVRRRRMRLRGVDEEAAVEGGDNKQVQIERVLVASLLAFLFCYTLVASTFLTFAFEGVHVLRKFNLEIRLRFLVAPCLFVFNPCLNFVLYVMCSKILRDDVRELFCAKFPRRKKRSTGNGFSRQLAKLSATASK